jgi:response regulator RpfG family c-di-GMP phosphodiesterase
MSLASTQPPDSVNAEFRGGSTHTVERALAIVRDHLEMDVAYVAEFTGGQEVYRALEGDAESFGLAEGEGSPLEETYCKRVADGLLSNVIPDTKADPRVSDLACTDEAGIGAYVGIPLVFTDGTVFGSFCCMSHQPDRSLAHRDISLMRVVASLVCDHIERDLIEAKNSTMREELVAARALSKSLDARDGYAGEHSEEVAAYAAQVATALGLGPEEIAEASQVALLHDIGKIGISDSILRKTEPLDQAEWAMMKNHTIIGYELAASIPSVAHIAPAIRAEHERWDGTGYPDGLGGTDIPIASRIVLACDAYHAMISDRPYRRAMSNDDAIKELLTNSGSQFDPAVAEALISVINNESDLSRPTGPARS